jgi:hypothetical protein
MFLSVRALKYVCIPSALWLAFVASASAVNVLADSVEISRPCYIPAQGFQPIRLDYVPYLRQSLLHSLQRAQAGEAEVGEVVAALDAYGLTKEDFAENMKELQFVIEGDKTLVGESATHSMPLRRVGWNHCF